MRKATSLTAALAFVLTLTTSAVLYIAPKGRVAYWADWSLLGLTKDQWSQLHLNLGVLFLAALALHLWYNWTPLLAYLKDKARRMKVFTPAFNSALALTLGTTVLTLAGLPPASWITDGNQYFQDRAARVYGEPPYGHAELSTLDTFSTQMKLDPAQAMARLIEAGIRFDGPTDSLLAVAKANGLSPKAVHAAMRDPQDMGAAMEMPATPPPGTGNRPLADLAAEYGLAIPTVLRNLRDKGVEADASSTIRQLAEKGPLGPVEIYDVLRRSAAQGAQTQP